MSEYTRKQMREAATSDCRKEPENDAFALRVMLRECLDELSEREQADAERAKAMAAAPPTEVVGEAASEKKFYIQDTRQIVGNCMLWWRKEAKGYTCELSEAMVVSESDIDQFDRSTDVLWPKDYIDHRSATFVDVQKVDRSQPVVMREEGGNNE